LPDANAARDRPVPDSFTKTLSKDHCEVSVRFATTAAQAHRVTQRFQLVFANRNRIDDGLMFVRDRLRKSTRVREMNC